MDKGSLLGQKKGQRQIKRGASGIQVLGCTESSILKLPAPLLFKLTDDWEPKYNSSPIENSFIPVHYSQALPCSSTSLPTKLRPVPGQKMKDSLCPWLWTVISRRSFPETPRLGQKGNLRLICMVRYNHPTDLQHHPAPTRRMVESNSRLETLNLNQQRRSRSPWVSCWGDTFPGAAQGPPAYGCKDTRYWRACVNWLPIRAANKNSLDLGRHHHREAKHLLLNWLHLLQHTEANEVSDWESRINLLILLYDACQIDKSRNTNGKVIKQDSLVSLFTFICSNVRKRKRQNRLSLLHCFP